MIAPGSLVRWDSGPRHWGGAPREYRGVVVAIVPRRSRAWPLCGGVERERLKCTDVVRAFDRALVEVTAPGGSLFFAPDLRRLTVLEEVRRG